MSRLPPVPLTGTVPAEIYAVGKAIQSVMVQLKDAKTKGLTVGQEIPVVLVGCLTDLLGALSGLAEIGPEFKEDSILAVKALLCPILDGMDVLLKK